jgi:hypothetical protein
MLGRANMMAPTYGVRQDDAVCRLREQKENYHSSEASGRMDFLPGVCCV